MLTQGEHAHSTQIRSGNRSQTLLTRRNRSQPEENMSLQEADRIGPDEMLLHDCRFRNRYPKAPSAPVHRTLHLAPPSLKLQGPPKGSKQMSSGLHPLPPCQAGGLFSHASNPIERILLRIIAGKITGSRLVLVPVPAVLTAVLHVRTCLLRSIIESE